MSASERFLTPLDRRLLEQLRGEPNVVHAARSLGIGRDRAVYRLARLARLFGGPVVRGLRGGASPGGSQLTRLGRHLLAERTGRRPPNRWTGVYHRRPSPRVLLAHGSQLAVAFRAREGETLAVEVDPEAFVVARRPVALSARNVMPSRIAALRRLRDGTVELHARWNEQDVRVALTASSVARLRLRVGGGAYLYAKAVAIRRVTRGSPRS
ncbi:MAG TPA: hypothetical protein VMH49_05245 [Thermoplasmata archaeon]|nr:hypothetical protein [Thermoplasmata archaeon]